MIQELDDNLDKIKHKWRVAWENKILQEIRSRISLWQKYLTDYFGDPEEFADVFPREVHLSVMLQLLSNEIVGKFKEKPILGFLDERLKSIFIPGDFLRIGIF